MQTLFYPQTSQPQDQNVTQQLQQQTRQSYSILRANDIRDILNKTLFTKDAYVLGKQIGTNIRRRFGDDGGCHCVYVGRDGRLSSPSLQSALVDGLLSCGMEVVQVGCGPTPMVYFAEKLLKGDVAVTVTGSHNALCDYRDNMFS